MDGGRIAIILVPVVRGDVVRGLADGALVARAAESVDTFLDAARNGRRARLLQADDVAAEAEAEVAVILAGDLLRRDVHLAVEQARALRKFRIRIRFFRHRGRHRRSRRLRSCWRRSRRAGFRSSRRRCVFGSDGRVLRSGFRRRLRSHLRS